jgi:hypothetical protein
LIRLLAYFLLFALPVAAQEPVLRAEIDKTEAIPGQAISLRLTVLVPTFMPEPPVWPNYETPNLLVRVASTGPVSERIDGATWAGISRRYLITPMVPGTVTLPRGDIVVTWADPEANEPKRETLMPDALTVTGIVPEGAEDLSPFVAANAVSLEQSVEGTPEGMTPGDSVVRTITATIDGASPMFLPPLITSQAIDGVRAYPATPLVEEVAERTSIRGTRTEKVTFVAEGGGAGEAPAVSLEWYNLQTGKLEIAELPALPLSVDGPPATSARPEPRDWRMIGLTGLASTITLAVLYAVLRRVAPRLRAWAGRQRDSWMQSETRAWHQLRRTIATRDHAAVRSALDHWASRLPGADPRRDPRLNTALTTLGATRYAVSPTRSTEAWHMLDRTLSGLRKEARETPQRWTLPPMNERI